MSILLWASIHEKFHEETRSNLRWCKAAFASWGTPLLAAAAVKETDPGEMSTCTYKDCKGAVRSAGGGRDGINKASCLGT